MRQTNIKCMYSTNVDDHNWGGYILWWLHSETREIFCEHCKIKYEDFLESYRLQIFLNEKMCGQLNNCKISPLPKEFYTQDAVQIAQLQSISTLSITNADLIASYILEYARCYKLDEPMYVSVSGFVLQALERCSDTFLVNEYENLFIWHWRIISMIQPEWLNIIQKRGITELLSNTIMNSRWVAHDFTAIVHS